MLAISLYKPLLMKNKCKMASTLKKISLSGDISIWGYLHNKMVFCYKLLSIFIIHQDLSFGGIALKIEFVVYKPGVCWPQADARLVS